MSLLEIVEMQREQIRLLSLQHGAGNVRVFGSAVRGEDGPESNVDFLVDIVGPTSSWFPSGLALDLETLLGRRVDVLTEKSLHPLLRDRVLKEARAV